MLIRLHTLHKLNKAKRMTSKIKLMAFDNATPAEVVSLALPMSFTAFAEKYGFTKYEVSQCVNGYRPHEKIREALAKEIDVSRTDIDSLLDTQSQTVGQ